LNKKLLTNVAMKGFVKQSYRRTRTVVTQTIPAVIIVNTRKIEMSIFHDFKKAYRKATPLEVAVNDLTIAELALLDAEAAVEYASALASCNKQRIARLKAYITAQTKAEKKEQAKEES
jgi:hypothetical protein